MEQVMKHLGIEIRPWILNRLVSSKVDLSTNTLTIAAHEIDATPASIFSGVSVNGTQLDKEPFEFVIFLHLSFVPSFMLSSFGLLFPFLVPAGD
jgi:hypothetical protein